MSFYAIDLCASIYTLHVFLHVVKRFGSLKVLHKFPVIIITIIINTVPNNIKQ